MHEIAMHEVTVTAAIAAQRDRLHGSAGPRRPPRAAATTDRRRRRPLPRRHDQ